MRHTSVGWIIRKTDRAVALTSNINTKDGISMRHTDGHILIPIWAITYIGCVSLPSCLEKSATPGHRWLSTRKAEILPFIFVHHRP